MAGNGWKLPGIVPFCALVLNINGYNNDYELNGMAIITVLTVSQYQKILPPNILALIVLPCFSPIFQSDNFTCESQSFRHKCTKLSSSHEIKEVMMEVH